MRGARRGHREYSQWNEEGLEFRLQTESWRIRFRLKVGVPNWFSDEPIAKGFGYELTTEPAVESL